VPLCASIAAGTRPPRNNKTARLSGGLECKIEIGAGDGIRTRDILLGKHGRLNGMSQAWNLEQNLSS
jgi:hypothetical protein